MLLRKLEEENSRLKKIVTDLSLDKEMIQDVLKKIFDHKADKDVGPRLGRSI